MALNLNKKKVCLFLKGIIFSVLAILVFTVGNSASAQPVFTDKLDLGLFWFLCGNEVYTDSLFNQIVLKVFPSKHFTIS